jgi:hypothetical protein
MNSLQQLVDGRPIHRIAAGTGQLDTAVPSHHKIPSQLVRIAAIAQRFPALQPGFEIVE